MDLIQMAKDLAKEIQRDERYLALRVATQNNDEDEHLQNLIGEFNLKRVALNHEGQKQEKDDQKTAALSQEINQLYKTIMEYPKMVAYNGAKQDVDKLMNYINRILLLSVNGENPDLIEDVDVSCSGSCSSCAGCM